jgi:ABC-2 type transport system ATP-binding protein
LDPHVRRDLRAEIATMRRDGRTVLLTTHDIDEAQALCDRIASIDRGPVIASGTPADLVAGSSAAPTVSLIADGPVDRAWLDAVPGLQDLSCDDHRVRFRTVKIGSALAAVVSALEARGLGLVDVSVDRPTLEDVLIELTAHAAVD